MSHFPQYSINPNNSDNNQFNMQGFDVNMLKNLIESSNNNVLTQNLNPQDVSYMQQNKMPSQYIIQLPNNNAVPIQQPYMQMMQFPYGNIYYVNQPTQFATNDQGVQYNATPVLPIQLSTGVMQVDVNDLNKINQQNTPTNSRSRKRSYSNQNKQENEILNDSNEEVLRDTRNRPLLYSCSDCSRKFSMQSRLTQHKKCHSGIRPYACSSCSFAFTQKSYLVRHAAVHKEERPYVCELCQKTYKHYGSLANHRKTHKNGSKASERPTNSDNNQSIDASGKVEEVVVDLNNNNATKSYHSGGNGEYLFQNQPAEMQQQTDQNQSFNNQFTTDISTDIFSNSFQNQMSANLSTDINPSFISQLNFHSNNFYSLIDPNANNNNETVKIEMTTNHQDQVSDLNNNNNSSISIESSMPLNLT